MGVKWPNDVIVDGGKIAGILLEARKTLLLAVVLILLHSEIFPEVIFPSGCRVIPTNWPINAICNFLADVYLDWLAY